jgi:ATP-dependent DNA ligase
MMPDVKAGSVRDHAEGPRHLPVPACASRRQGVARRFDLALKPAGLTRPVLPADVAQPAGTAQSRQRRRAAGDGPHDADGQYEPKWDGFRAIAFRDGDEHLIQSRNGKPLGRYFPELVRALIALSPRQFVLDGEIMLFVDGKPSFETLQLRLHPAATSPGGRDRWSGRERKVVPLRPELVVEASTDHITDRRFRHGARILRWRTDKDPRDCTMDQIERR